MNLWSRNSAEEGKSLGGYLISDEYQARILEMDKRGGWWVNFLVDGQPLGFSTYFLSEKAKMESDLERFRAKYGERLMVISEAVIGTDNVPNS